jgi:phage shock protein A
VLFERLTQSAGALVALPSTIEATLRRMATAIGEIQEQLTSVVDVPRLLDNRLREANELLASTREQLAQTHDEVRQTNEQLAQLIRVMAPLERAAQRGERVAQALRRNRPAE